MRDKLSSSAAQESTQTDAERVSLKCRKSRKRRGPWIGSKLASGLCSDLDVRRCMQKRHIADHRDMCLKVHVLPSAQQINHDEFLEDGRVLYQCGVSRDLNKILTRFGISRPTFSSRCIIESIDYAQTGARSRTYLVPPIVPVGLEQLVAIAVRCRILEGSQHR